MRVVPNADGRPDRVEEAGEIQGASRHPGAALTLRRIPHRRSRRSEKAG